MRYVKFFFVFNRFVLKCFFYEALKFFGYAAKICIIDNTSLVVDYGTGERAVFSPEMLQFAKQYGFQWKAHRIRLANRKAGKERNFLTLQTNFFPACQGSSYSPPQGHVNSPVSIGSRSSSPLSQRGWRRELWICGQLGAKRRVVHISTTLFHPR